MKPILIVLPSKGRPEKIEGFYETWRKTTNGLSEVITFLDEDDPSLKKYKKHKDITLEIGSGRSFSDACNRAFNTHPNYKYYFIVSDDHRIRSKNWEKRFTNIIEENGGKGVSFGDDLMYGDKIASAALVSGNIFRALGFVTLPGLIHMYTDAFWTEVGRRLNKLFYFPDIIVEHLHFTVGKSPVDSIYLSVDNKIVYEHDKKVFNTWKRGKMKKDIEKIKAYNRS